MTVQNRTASDNMLRSQTLTLESFCALPSHALISEILCALGITICILGLAVRMIL